MKEVVLGLDVSTSKIGLSIMDYNNNLISCQVIKLNSKDSLFKRCIELENILSKINGINYINNNNKLYIKEVFIESPFMMFSGGKTTAMTMAKLQRFNGMVSYMVRREIGIEPVMIAANKARGLVGLKLKRGDNTKLKVIEWVQNEYPKDFIVEYTRHGNPKPGTDDKADSVVIAKAGLLMEKE
jgi:Holliday junction resolvasome RuvABC endonuclease subunit